MIDRSGNDKHAAGPYYCASTAAGFFEQVNATPERARAGTRRADHRHHFSGGRRESVSWVNMAPF